MRKSFVLLFLISSFLFALESPENLPVRSIKIEVVGEREGSADEILSSLKTREHEHFSQTDFDKDLKLMAKEFERIEPSVSVVDGEVVIECTVWKKPVIHSINWSGNETYNAERLQKELEISRGSVFDQQGFAKAVQKVRKYYVKHGFFEVEVDYSLIPTSEPHAIDVAICVHEGRAGYVNDVEFVNFTPKEISEIYDRMHTTEYCWWHSWITNRGTFYKELFQQDEMMILSYLQNQGYLDARVETEIVAAPNKKNRINIRIIADKGGEYFLGDISVSGNVIFDQKQILDRAHLVSGSPYSPDDVRHAAQAVTALYGSKGYIDAAVVPDARLRISDKKYDVHFRVDEGQCYRVGMIDIMGNTKTDTRVILHETLLRPGEVFDTRLLRKTEERLLNTGYFKSVNVYAVKSSRISGGATPFRDVHIEVDEGLTTFKLTAFVGWNSNQGFAGGGGISEDNFKLAGLAHFITQGPRALRGGGEHINLKATFGTKMRVYSLSYTKPYVFDTPWILGVDLDKKRDSYSSDSYAIQSNMLVVSGKYPINPFLRAGPHYRLSNSKIDLRKKKSRDPDLLREKKLGGTISAIGLELEYDSTQKPFRPDSGVRSTLSAEYAGIGGHHNFLTFNYLNSLYCSSYGVGIWKLKMDLRAIQTLDGTKPHTLPLSERLYLGGEHTIRGFRYNAVGPLFKDKDYTPRGGTTSALFSVEYEYPIYRQLNGFVFCDAGNVCWKQWTVSKLRYSPGFGLRFYIAEHAPLSFGFGFPVNAGRKEDVQRFFFSIGIGM